MEIKNIHSKTVVVNNCVGLDQFNAINSLVEEHGNGSLIVINDPGGKIGDYHIHSKIFYIFESMPSISHLAAVVAASINNREQSISNVDYQQQNYVDPVGVRSALNCASMLERIDNLIEARDYIVEQMKEIFDADRVYMNYVIDNVMDAGNSNSCDVTGLNGYIKVSGETSILSSARDHALYSCSVDDPVGDGSERLMVTSIRENNESCLATVIIVRNKDKDQFTTEDEKLLKLIIWCLRYSIQKLLIESQLKGYEGQNKYTMSYFPTFHRIEAVKSYTDGKYIDGEAIRLYPNWTKSASNLILIFILALMLFAVIVKVPEYADGQGLIVFADEKSVTSSFSGTVSKVLVRVGQRIESGTNLIVFDDDEQSAELEKATEEFHLGLMQRLLDPNNAELAQWLAGLRVQMNLASKKLALRTVKSPYGGSVTNISAKTGQSYVPGDLLVSVNTGDDKPYIYVFLAGQYLPKLGNGMSIKIDIPGYGHVFNPVNVASVSNSVMDSQEAKRLLPAGMTDAVDLP
ncbi:MAG: biotin/lipoyl-binding protein, partial [Candidatus Saccharimonadales bacterium]